MARPWASRRRLQVNIQPLANHEAAVGLFIACYSLRRAHVLRGMASTAICTRHGWVASCFGSRWLETGLGSRRPDSVRLDRTLSMC